MKIILLLFLVFITEISFSQDIELFHRYKNDNYEMPKIDSDMSFEEFKMLSYNLKMIDMVEAAIVPGYVHFKTGEKKMAYSLLGLRIISYAAISFVVFDKDIKLSGLTVSLINENINKDATKYKGVYISALMLATSTYLFDWIRGSYSLKHKQEQIRYKYSMQMSLSSYSGFQGGLFKNNQIPTLGLTVNF